jgi:hypothetical protein
LALSCALSLAFCTRKPAKRGETVHHSTGWYVKSEDNECGWVLRSLLKSIIEICLVRGCAVLPCRLALSRLFAGEGWTVAEWRCAGVPFAVYRRWICRSLRSLERIRKVIYFLPVAGRRIWLSRVHCHWNFVLANPQRRMQVRIILSSHTYGTRITGLVGSLARLRGRSSRFASCAVAQYYRADSHYREALCR